MDLAAILTSQYLASLAMLRETIGKCPAGVWDAPEDAFKFWHKAYHALYFVHAYLSESEASMKPWSKHRSGYEEFAEGRTYEPYTRDELLEYLTLCERYVRERVPQLHLEDMEHLDRPEYTIMELQIYSIRHVMQHAGELMERAGSRAGVEIGWVGAVRER